MQITETLPYKKKCYNADVIIESISGDITAKIVNARNSCDKEYNGTENYSFELQTQTDKELSENENTMWLWNTLMISIY